MTDWLARLAAAGFSPEAAQRSAPLYARVADALATRPGATTDARAWWVPGRIEVLGKHTDYGGGRSLLCTVERGFHVMASARADAVLSMLDLSSGDAVDVSIDADTPSRPGHWSNYVISVARRVARDFPGRHHGIDLVFQSSLPAASGMSSSSALVIGCFLPLAAFNELCGTETWAREIPDDDGLAGYLGAVESGRAFGALAADRGVGAQIGSEDQTAILRAVPGSLLQYHFLPVTHEATIPLSPEWTFVIAMSGVHAAKGSTAQARYNALANEIGTLLKLWRDYTYREDHSLLAVLDSAPDASYQLARIALSNNRPPLAARLEQFREECELIPEVARRLARGDVQSIAPFVRRSQQMAEQVLGNQVPETVHLARRATELGASAASAFGAGFGGSVWALIESADAEAFRGRWHADYVSAFPARTSRAEFFVSRPGPPATELDIDRGRKP